MIYALADFLAEKLKRIQGIANGAITGIVPSRQAAENMSDEELNRATCHAKRHRPMDGGNDVDVHPRAHGYSACR